MDKNVSDIIDVIFLITASILLGFEFGWKVGISVLLLTYIISPNR